MKAISTQYAFETYENTWTVLMMIYNEVDLLIYILV